MNISPNSSTGKTPHEIVFGRPAINPFATILQNTDYSIPAVTDFAAQRQSLWQQVHTAIEKAKEQQKR